MAYVLDRLLKASLLRYFPHAFFFFQSIADIEKYVDTGTIVEIPFLIKAIIIWYMVILEVLLAFLGIQKRSR